jgi:hypothetical protein
MANIVVYPGHRIDADVEYYYHRSRVVKMDMDDRVLPGIRSHHSGYKCPVVNVEPCRFTVFIRKCVKGVNIVQN